MLLLLTRKFTNLLPDTLVHLSRVAPSSLPYLKTIAMAIVIDSMLIDDEPLWEPIEWSLVQSWLIIIFIFSWIAENLISSRYGSFVGRDKRVWVGWYRTYWFIEFFFLFNLIIIVAFIISPFYFEISYDISNIVVWWDWYTVKFLVRFALVFTTINLISVYILITYRWLSLNAISIGCIIILLLYSAIFFFLFISVSFMFLTDPLLFRESGWSNGSKLTQGPLKWGWGDTDRDHFLYHKTTVTFWFKNELPFCSAMFFNSFMFFIFYVFFVLQWFVLLRILYSTAYISYSLLTYFMYITNQLYYFLMLLYFALTLLSLLCQLMRFPFELFFFVNIVQSLDTIFLAYISF